MGPYQIMGIIACCTIVFAGVVTLLTMQGMHILLALLVVYLVAIWCMLGMQRRARESYEIREEFRSRSHTGESLPGRVRSSDFQSPGRAVGQQAVHHQLRV
ncbi:MAG: hypothetical protein HKN42_10595 [Granulosicoccus sp.]|nr:hypothetical protein [Granulosicoccus sp.]